MAEYIEREAVLSKFLEYGIGCGAAKVKGVINSIPSADVQPVRHGRWDSANTRPRTWQFRCSECGNIAYYPTPKYFSHGCDYHYCPNCGAKMDQPK